jgi:nitrate reductase / nitrite oxidoreductase, alpha subunit
MSYFLDRLTFFNRVVDDFSDGYGVVTREDRRWEDGYRKRWQHDKIVRSTHGANCTGSCSWKIYVKGGIVTWDTPGPLPLGCSFSSMGQCYLDRGSTVVRPAERPPRATFLPRV